MSDKDNNDIPKFKVVKYEGEDPRDEIVNDILNDHISKVNDIINKKSDLMILGDEIVDPDKIDIDNYDEYTDPSDFQKLLNLKQFPFGNVNTLNQETDKMNAKSKGLFDNHKYIKHELSKLTTKLYAGPNECIFNRDAYIKSIVLLDREIGSLFSIDLNLKLKKIYSFWEEFRNKPCAIAFHINIPKINKRITILLDISLKKQAIFMLVKQDIENSPIVFDHILLERIIEPKINATIDVELNYR